MSSPEEILETYEISPGVSAVIYRDKDGFLRYRAVEPRLAPEDAEALERLKATISDVALRGRAQGGGEGQLRLAAEEAAKKFKITPRSWDKVFYYLKRDLLGYGGLDPLLRDPFLEDVHVDGPGAVYVWHSKWESLPADVPLSGEELERLVHKLAALSGKNVSYASPILEAMLPEGYRLELVYAPASAKGPSLTIRKYFVEPITLVDMIKMGTASAELVAYLWFMLDHGRNIIIVGPTGAGKTTLLNALLYLIKPSAKIITIEDTREINIVHDHWQALVTRPSLDPSVRDITALHLLQVAMRSRPDYVVVGEIRGEEAYVLFQAFSSGHAGATTMHAETVDDAVKRLLSRPMEVPPVLLGLAHIFVRILRVKTAKGVARRIVEVYENLGVEGGAPRLHLVFKWDPPRDKIERAAPSALMDAISRSFFVSREELEEDLKAREEAIRLMYEHGLSSPAAVARVASAYYANRERALKSLGEGRLP